MKENSLKTRARWSEGSSGRTPVALSCWPLLLALLALPASLQAQAATGDRFDPVRAFIRQAMEEHDLPSVAVAVAKDGRILWEEGFGWADLERRIPATPETMYSLASISKPMTATALMRLVEQEQIDLDGPANHYLADGKIHSPVPVWDPEGATVRRVLSHTAGLPLHYEFFYQGETHPARTTDEAIARYGVLVTPPGEIYEYSNLGYGILERILERVTRRDYGGALRNLVFEPLGMTRSAVSTGAGLGDAAAVRYDGSNRPIPPYDFDHRGASAVYSSANDLVRFGMFHLGNRTAGQRPILRDATRREMQEIATPGSAEQGYALGWGIVADDNGYRRVAHTGGMPGVATVLNLYPDENLAVVVLTNTSNRVVNRIAQEITGTVLPRYRSVRREREVSAAGTPATASGSIPSADLMGEWVGTVRIPGGATPIALLFQPDGDVHVRLGDGMVTLLNNTSFRDGHLLGRFSGALPFDDARNHPHTVLLNLRLRDGRLVGAASAQTIADPIYFALSGYVELDRK